MDLINEFVEEFNLNETYLFIIPILKLAIGFSVIYIFYFLG